MIDDDLRRGLQEGIADGTVEVIGKRDGEALFRLTEAGQTHVEALLDRRILHAIQALAEDLDLPEDIASDLILRRASQLWAEQEKK